MSVDGKHCVIDVGKYWWQTVGRLFPLHNVNDIDCTECPRCLLCVGCVFTLVPSAGVVITHDHADALNGLDGSPPPKTLLQAAAQLSSVCCLQTYGIGREHVPNPKSRQCVCFLTLSQWAPSRPDSLTY